MNSRLTRRSLLDLIAGAALGVALSPTAVMASGGGAKEESPATASRFLPLETITLPVIRNRQVEKLVSIQITFELAEGSSINKLLPYMRELQDATFVQLTSLIALKWPDGAIIDLEIAKRRILKRAREIAGDAVQAALVTHILERAA